MALWRVPAPVAAACAAIEFGQGSGRRRGLPRRRRSTAVAFCPTAVSAHESRELLLLNTQNTGVSVPWPRVVAVWPLG